MMHKKSFRDPVTGVLKGWGYSDQPSDVKQDEGDTFCLEPYKWKFINGAWKPYEDNARKVMEQIEALERESLLNRGTREMQLSQIEEKAAQVASVQGVSVASVLSANIYYGRLKALDAQITALRGKL